MTILLIACAIMSAVVALYPYTAYPALLRTMPRVKGCSGPEPAVAHDGSNFALIFCAYNERQNIHKKLRNLSEMLREYPKLTIHVYDDCSNDGTSEILANSELPMRRILSNTRNGKAHGMKLLSSSTDRDFLIFTDANVYVEPGSINRLSEIYKDSHVGGVCGTLRYINADTGTTSDATGAYWKLEERIKTLESATGNVMGADGSIFSVRSVHYPSFPNTVLDDLTVSMQVIFDGSRLVKDESVVGLEEILSDQGKDLRRRVRISMRAHHTHIWLKASIAGMSLNDRWRYFSHRLLRWYGGFALILSVLFLTTAITLASPQMGAVFLIGSILTALLAMRWNLGPLSTITHIALSMILTSYGVTKSLAGKTRPTWDPPR